VRREDLARNFHPLPDVLVQKKKKKAKERGEKKILFFSSFTLALFLSLRCCEEESAKKIRRWQMKGWR
jgi:hypothetical protein